MRRILKITLLLSILLSSVTAKAEVEEPTRVLLIVDCSASMWNQWQSAPKVKVMQQVLLSFLDSVNTEPHIEVAMRVFGHLNRQQFGTRLEVPFGENNLYRLQSKIKTLVPNGGCTAGAALTDALSDFPTIGDARNIILIITDGMDDRDAEICEVARQVQLSGVVVQTFVVCIGSEAVHYEGCVGSLYTVPNEDGFGRTLHSILSRSASRTRVVLRINDSEGQPTEGNHAVAFHDHTSGTVQKITICNGDAAHNPDTLMLDPLMVYDLTIYTHPPLKREALSFDVDHVNEVVMVATEGSLKVVQDGQRPSANLPMTEVVVRRAGSGDRIAAQVIGEEGSYLAGRYDVEVQTLPVTTFKGVEIRAGAATTLEVSAPGQLILSKPRAICIGAIFRLNDGRAEFTTDLDPSTAGERLMLQPGEYEVVLRPQNASNYAAVETRRFVIESRQTTKVQF